MTKKAMVESQFNWIFVLVAGAVIMLFFTTLVIKQRAIAQEKLDLEISTKLHSILNNAKESTGTLFSVKIPKSTIEYYAGEGFSVGSEIIDVGEAFSATPLSSTTKQFLIEAVPFELPFKVTNFLFASTPDIRYIIVDDDPDQTNPSYADTFYYVAANVTKEWVVPEQTKDLQGITNRNNYKIRFVFFNDGPTDYIFPDFIWDYDVSAIKVTIEGTNLNSHGTITFYEKDGTGFVAKGTPPKYIRKEAILGAMFAEDAGVYDYSFKHAIKKADVVAQVYKQKVSSLDELYDDAVCSPLYGQIENKLGELIDALEIVTIDTQSIYDLADEISKWNQALQINSCPQLY